jgi:hypothetical protein
VRPYSRGQKNDFRDAEAIAEAVQRPTSSSEIQKKGEAEAPNSASQTGRCTSAFLCSFLVTIFNVGCAIKETFN